MWKQTPFRLIVSRGRIDDRSPNAIAGATLTGAAIATRLALQAKTIGTPVPHKSDDWRSSLHEANPTLTGIAIAVRTAFRQHQTPLIAASSCAVSLATLPVAAGCIPDLKVLWVDAHGDFNTPETTATGYLGGMTLAAVCGLWDSGHRSGVDPKRILIAGARDIDVQEETLLQEAGVKLLSPSMSDPQVIGAFIGDGPIWVHIDWDALEPGHVPTAYPVSDGLLPAQLRAILHAIPVGQVAGIELIEFEAPEDHAERTAAIATLMAIVEPLFGGGEHGRRAPS